MPRRIEPLTVDELIAELTEHSRQGRGSWVVVYNDFENGRVEITETSIYPTGDEAYEVAQYERDHPVIVVDGL